MHIKEARHEYVRWLRETRTLSSHTLRAYAGDVVALERSASVDLQSIDGEIALVSPDMLLRFVSGALDGGASPATLIRRCSALRGFFRWLAREGHIASNPWDALDLGIRRGRSLPRAVGADDLRRLVGGTNRAGDDPTLGNAPSLAARATDIAVLLLLVTGLRVGELVAVRVQDVDIEVRSIRVLGKGRRERVVYLPKGDQLNVIAMYLADRLRAEVGHDILLVNRLCDPLSAAALRARLAKAGRAAGLSIPVTPHMLRHSAATQLVEAGVDIRFIQRLLGHSSISTTEIYTHVTDTALRRVLGDADVLGADPTSITRNYQR